MIDLKPNGPPTCRKQVMRLAVYLLALLFCLVWFMPVSFAEPAEYLEVEGGITKPDVPVINKISHRMEGDTDIFTFGYLGELSKPTVRVETDGIWLDITGCTVDIPSGSDGKFSTPVKGELIGRLDVKVDYASPSAVIGLISLSGVRFNCDLTFNDNSEFEVRCFGMPVVDEVIEEPVQVIKPEVIPDAGLPVVPAQATTRITKVRYDPVGDTDRFTFNIDGPMPDVEMTILRYPDRVKVDIISAEVDLPDQAEGRFETPVPGLGITHLQAINTETDGSSVADFTLLVDPAVTADNIHLNMDASHPDRITIDVQRIGVVAPQPVEIPAVIQPAPQAVPEPVVTPEVVPTEIPAIVSAPAPAPPVAAPEVVAPPMIVKPPAPVAPTPISVDVSIYPSENGGMVIHLQSDQPISKPSLKKLSYPARLGLTLPYVSVDFKGDKSGSWSVNEGPVTNMRTSDFVSDDEAGSSLFVYIDGKIDPSRVSTELRSTSGSSYDILINVKPEVNVQMPELTVAPPTLEPVVAVPVVVATAPVAPKVEEVVGPEPVEAAIEIEVESYEVPVEVEEPAPVIETPSPVQAPAIVAEPQPVIPELVAPTPAIPTPEVEAPVETPVQPLVLYPTFSVESKPSDSGNDRFVLKFDGQVTEPEVKVFNHPPRLMLVFSDTQVAGGTDRYDYNKIEGGVIANRYKYWSESSTDEVKSILEIDAVSAGSPEDIGYNIDRQGDSLVVNIFPADGMEPPEREIPQPMNPERIDPIPPLPEDLGTNPAEPKPLPELNPESLETAPEVKVEGEAAPADDDTGPKIKAFNVKDGNVVDILQVICTEAGISNIIDPSVVGRVSLSLQEPMSVEQVLGLLGEIANFSYYVTETGVYIFASERVLEQKFPGFYDTWIIELSYADPNQVRTILTNQGIIDAKNIIIYNPSAVNQSTLYSSTRKLLIRGSDKDVKVAIELIKQMDEPPVQIQYDLKVIQTSANIRKAMGVAWLTNTEAAENIGAVSWTMKEKGSGTSQTDFLPQGFIRDPYNFSATLNYLESNGDAKLLANPTISALNGQPASYFVGQEVPFRSTFQVSDIGRVTQRIANASIGITLNITGVASNDGSVTMYISPSVSNLLELTDIGPRTSQNRFSTTMRVLDGETFIMAGLINEEERVTNNKVPILGDLPLFGGLFKSKKNDIDRSELIITITPHILEPVDYNGPTIKKGTGLESIFTGK